MSDPLERNPPIPQTAPVISWAIHPRDPARPWTCYIQMPDDTYHGGSGKTQCEALGQAWMHWAMHGETK